MIIEVNPNGHLPQGAIRAIKELLKAGVTAGKVGRTTYFLSKAGDTYTVIRQLKETTTIGAPARTVQYTDTFKVKGENNQPQLFEL